MLAAYVTYRFDCAVTFHVKMLRLPARRAAGKLQKSQASRRSRDKQQVADPEAAHDRKIVANLAPTSAFELFKKEQLENVYCTYGGKDTVEKIVIKDHQREVG